MCSVVWISTWLHGRVTPMTRLPDQTFLRSCGCVIVHWIRRLSGSIWCCPSGWGLSHGVCALMLCVVYISWIYRWWPAYIYIRYAESSLKASRRSVGIPAARWIWGSHKRPHDLQSWDWVDGYSGRPIFVIERKRKNCTWIAWPCVKRVMELPRCRSVCWCVLWMANAPKNPPVSQRQRATKEYQREKSVNLAENKLFAFVCSVVSCTLCGDVSVYGMFVMSAFRICNSSLVALFFSTSYVFYCCHSFTVYYDWVDCAMCIRGTSSTLSCMYALPFGRPAGRYLVGSLAVALHHSSEPPWFGGENVRQSPVAPIATVCLLASRVVLPSARCYGRPLSVGTKWIYNFRNGNEFSKRTDNEPSD